MIAPFFVALKSNMEMKQAGRFGTADTQKGDFIK